MLRMRHVDRPLAAEIFPFGVAAEREIHEDRATHSASIRSVAHQSHVVSPQRPRPNEKKHTTVPVPGTETGPNGQPIEGGTMGRLNTALVEVMEMVSCSGARRSFHTVFPADDECSVRVFA
jgi:hypothetical protein